MRFLVALIFFLKNWNDFLPFFGVPLLISMVTEMDNKVLRADSETFGETQNVFERMSEPDCIAFTVQNVDLRFCNKQRACSSEVAPAIDEDNEANRCVNLAQKPGGIGQCGMSNRSIVRCRFDHYYKYSI